MKEKKVIGIDIGGTNTNLALVDAEGQITLHKHLRTTGFPSAARYIAALREVIHAIELDMGTDAEIVSVGIGAPNGNYYSGKIEYAPNMPWKGVIDLGATLEKELQMPVVLTNDANAAALGEKQYGGADGMNDFIVITIGTGLGSGIMVNGKVLYGHSGFAGEIGHTTAIHGGRRCTCGKYGCLEAYVSARGLKDNLRDVIEAGETNSSLHLSDVDNMSALGVYELAGQGDPAARAAFTETGRILGRHLADSVAYTSPEAIFLFGGIAHAGDLIMAPTLHHLNANLLKVFQGRVKLLPSQLKGHDAAILGAAALAWSVYSPSRTRA